MTWANPEWFWAFLLLLPVLGLGAYRWYAKRTPSVLFSSTEHLEQLPGNWKQYGPLLNTVLLCLSIGLLITALARPQLQNTTIERNAEGIDIMLVLDLSTSMLAEDIKPNRFEAAKRVAIDFINKRTADRIGLVVFAAESFTVCPPTLDYRLLAKLLSDVKMGVVRDGTAIGMGMATAINRLKDSDAKSKIIILLTDGENNTGEIDPVTAADLAVAYGIKVYTIGAGTRGTAPYPIQDPIFGKRYQNVPVDIDEDMLIKIANMTNAKYYRATNTQGLQDVYDEINTLEKTKVEELIFTDYKDLYNQFLIPALILFALAMVAEWWLFKTTLSIS